MGLYPYTSLKMGHETCCQHPPSVLEVWLGTSRGSAKASELLQSWATTREIRNTLQQVMVIVHLSGLRPSQTTYQGIHTTTSLVVPGDVRSSPGLDQGMAFGYGALPIDSACHAMGLHDSYGFFKHCWHTHAIMTTLWFESATQRTAFA